MFKQNASFTDFGTLQKELEAKEIEILSSGFDRIPQTTQSLNEAKVEEVEKLLEVIEQDEDVLNVYHNMVNE